MHLRPYAEVDGVAFAATQEWLVVRLGPPLAIGRNGVGLTELDYGRSVFRFQDSGRLEEVTGRAAVLHLGEVAVPFASLHGFVRAQDPAAFERAGFVVSPRYGVAFAPESPDWVTALAEHSIAHWQAL